LRMARTPGARVEEGGGGGAGWETGAGVRNSWVFAFFGGR